MPDDMPDVDDMSLGLAHREIRKVVAWRKRIAAVTVEHGEDADGAQWVEWTVGVRRLRVVSGCLECGGQLWYEKSRDGAIVREATLSPQDIWGLIRQLKWVGRGDRFEEPE